jgi:uncharacterized protein (DUF362 family)
MRSPRIDRRRFLGGVSAGVVGTALAGRGLHPRIARAETFLTPGSAQVGLIKGGDRRRNMLEALRAIEKEVRTGIGDRQVVIKPNFVTTGKQLAATHVEGVMGILDFLKPFYNKPVIIAESPAGGPAERGYENYGYTKLTRDYRVALQELDADKHRTYYLMDRHLQPTPVRMSRMLCDPGYYVISAAALKTHNAVVATLGLKNLLVGGALKLGGKNDKRQFHQGTKLINYNLYLLARDIRPHLTTIDGFQAMEGNGPTGGTPVDSQVAIAGTDAVATDRVGLAVMGIDLADVGYLTYCVNGGLGQGDLAKIDLVGSDLASCTRKFRMADSIAGQLKWKSDDFQSISLKGDVRS